MNYFIDMKKQYKIQLPKGKKVTMTNVDFENGVMTVNVELENRKEQEYGPKDGDFICYDDNYGLNIGIYKLKYVLGHKLYCFYNDKKGLYDKGVNITELNFTCRPATEEEKKILIDKLASFNLHWDPVYKRIEKIRWRAEIGERFYFIDRFGCINSMNRNDFHPTYKKYDSIGEQLEDERMENFEYMCWKKGNYFKTREAAERTLLQLKELIKNSEAE